LNDVRYFARKKSDETWQIELPQNVCHIQIEFEADCARFEHCDEGRLSVEDIAYQNKDRLREKPLDASIGRKGRAKRASPGIRPRIEENRAVAGCAAMSDSTSPTE
jgi:hypothetical protein